MLNYSFNILLQELVKMRWISVSVMHFHTYTDCFLLCVAGSQINKTANVIECCRIFYFPGRFHPPDYTPYAGGTGKSIHFH